jgi:signal peptidase I
MADSQTPPTPPEAAPRSDAAPAAANRWSRLWAEWVKPFLMVLIVVGSLRSAVADWNDVPTGSMMPTILPGERIFVNKLAYDLKVPFTRLRVLEWDAPERGDVVVLYSPADGKRLVKRVIGLPGDELAVYNGYLYIDGERAEYQPFAAGDHDALGLEGERGDQVVWESLGPRSHPVTWTPIHRVLPNYGPMVVPPGSYFVMGDNRDNSRDSRVFGVVDRELIVGEALAVVVSLDRDEGWKPRWSRFFTELP